MILNLDQQDGIKIGAEGTKIGINLNKGQKLKYLLSQGLYSRKEESTCRELCSNIIDSYINTGRSIMDYPGYVILTDTHVIFKDEGSGMSHDFINETYCNFLSSSKENDSEAIGFWGIGSKSPWSVSSQFLLTTTCDKSKRTYLLNRDSFEDTLIPISEEIVDEPNGTTVTIPIQQGTQKLWYDTIIQTIPYFKGILFECQIENDYYSSWNKSKEFNESKLIEGKTFYYRESAPKYFHICLDQVIYKLNPNDFGISLNNFPFGLKFSVSEGLTPIPSRENLIIGESTKVLILKRLRECLEELHEYYQEDSLTLPEYFKDSSNLKFKIGEKELQLTKMEINSLCEGLGVKSFIKFNPVFADIPNLSNKKYFFYACLDVTGQIGKSKITSNRYYSKSNVSRVIIGKGFTSAQNRFLRENYEGWYIGKIHKQKFWGINGFYQTLELKSIPKDKWRPIVEAWIKEQQEWIKDAIEFSEDQYQEWLSEQVRNKPTRRKLEDEEIKLSFLARKERGVGLKLVPQVSKISDLYKQQVYVYFEELNFKASQFYELQNRRVIPIIIDTKNLAKLKQYKGITVLSPEKFEKSKYFKRLVFKKWITGYAESAGYCIKNSFNEYNGILRTHYSETQHLRQKGNKNLPDFLNGYELDSKYRPIKNYLQTVEEKALKLTLNENDDYYGSKSKKRLFVCQLKVKRLERELNKFKQTNHNQ